MFKFTIFNKNRAINIIDLLYFLLFHNIIFTSDTIYLLLKKKKIYIYILNVMLKKDGQ